MLSRAAAALMEGTSPLLPETVPFICPSLLAGTGDTAQLYLPGVNFMWGPIPPSPASPIIIFDMLTPTVSKNTVCLQSCTQSYDLMISELDLQSSITPDKRV